MLLGFQRFSAIPHPSTGEVAQCNNVLNDLHLILSESVEFLMRKTSGCNVGETPSMEFSKQTHFVQQVWVTALQNHPGNNSTLVLLKAPLGCTQGPPAAPPPPGTLGTAFPGWMLVPAAPWCPQPTLAALSGQEMQHKPPRAQH